MPKRERPTRFPPHLRGGDDKVVPDSNVAAVQPIAEQVLFQHPSSVWRRVAYEIVLQCAPSEDFTQIGSFSKR
jgi:hypothetical protein